MEPPEKVVTNLFALVNYMVTHPLHLAPCEMTGSQRVIHLQQRLVAKKNMWVGIV